MSVSFAPLIPLWLLATLAAASVAIAALAVVRGARGAGLRLVPMAALLLALANPLLIAEDRRPLPDVAVVVVDESLSQGVGERRAETERAVAALRQRLDALPGLEVRVVRVGGGDGTRLFEALDAGLADLPRRRLAGVVMITDGQVHDVPADLGRGLGAPLHALLTGRPGERDRRIVVADNPGFALVGRSATLAVTVEEAGATGSATLAVQADGVPLLTTAVPLNTPVSIEVPIRHAGQTVVELAAAPAEGELSAANNRTAVGLSGVRDRLKVLLVSGEPHAGERTWRNFLKADPAVDLVHFTILRSPEKDDRTPIRELALITFPVRELFEERLQDFDLVIFDRYRRRGLLAQPYYLALADYVRAGGALLVSVGPEYAEPGSLWDTPLQAVLPARPGGRVVARPFRPQPTEIGRRHPVTGPLAGEAAWGRWLRLTTVEPLRGSAVLSGSEGRPVMLLDKVGEGRVAMVLSDTIWLWDRGWEGGGPHDELLRRLAHWLMKEPELEEEALTAEVKGERLEVTRRSLTPPPPGVAVIRPDGRRLDLPLVDQGDGRGFASLAADQPGLWRVEDGARTALAAVGGLDSQEMAELVATPARLHPVAEASGGAVSWLAEGLPELRRVAPRRTAHGRGWIGLASRGDAVVTGVRTVPLLPAPLLLLAVLGGLLAAWRREGR
ncbi:MAG: hypothetical protein HY985_12450 [Magnetospirillum sp.]|nr:hypothetical protein [Magnetospirillum sp.]